MTDRSGGRRLIAAALCLVIAAGCGARKVGPDAPSTIELWKSNASPAAWNPVTREIIYNSRGRDGLWDAYGARPDGTGVRCITCDTPRLGQAGTRTHRGVSDASPDGRYLLLHVEKDPHEGQPGATEAEHGKGVYNDIWLATDDGAHAWRLTDVSGNRHHGTMWARFDRTGEQIVWAELHQAADLRHPVGQWRLMLARITWHEQVPSLTAVRSYEPETGKFYEPYGFSPDNQRIIFASDVTMPGFWDTQIWTVRADLTDLTRVSPADAGTGFFRNYNEFAFYLPGRDRIIFSRTRNATSRGMDYWSARADGSDAVRLTTMNQPGTDQHLGYAIAGGLAFDPDDPNRFVASVAADLLGTRLSAYLITLHE